DESALTGESVPAEKATAPAEADAVPGDRLCMAFSGTLVVCGQAEGVVAATGAGTELGRISALLNQVAPLDTPLQRQLAQFGHWLTLAILLLSAATFAFGVLVRHYGLEEMFMAVVGIAVAAIPEGLPAVVTITLAVGVQRMARRNAIVRNLPAVETLGSVTVICSDKTGTLTRNEMAVRSVALAGADLAHGAEAWAAAAAQPRWLELARAAVLCNDATTGPTLHGDPTETALLALGLASGLDIDATRHDFPRLDTIPFESEHRFMATLHGGGWIYVKGAPEAVLPRCARQREVAGEDTRLNLDYWHGRVLRMAQQGKRVLALAAKPADGADTLDMAGLGKDFTLLGLLGLIDPPKDEAIRSVAQCHAAGIRVKMITGDHGVTASAIGRQLAIGEEGAEAMLGAEIETLSPQTLAVAARDTDVFARASPEHKLRLVEALQAKGQVVAMTGDGVNDAPALKRADIGVAMGKKGTEAAKEAAVMVLADDNFATIVHAVEEGRTIHDNLKKAIVYILPTSFGQAGAIMIGIMLGLELPVTPLQILWVNMVTAISLSLSLSFEPSEAGVMRRPPRNPKAALLDAFFLWRIGFVALLLVAGLLGLFLYERHWGASLAAARTAAVNALTIGEIAYLFNSRFIHAPALSWRGITGNRYALLAVAGLALLQAGFTYLPPLQALFATEALGVEAWQRIAAFGLALFLIVEAEKALVRLWRRHRPAPPPLAVAPNNAKRTALTRYAWLSIAAALLTIGLKAWAWWLTGSVGLLSDAMESVVNLVAAVMALAMLTLAARPPDADHHFGHGKAEYFSSGLEGALILVAAAGIIWAAWERLLYPAPLESLGFGLGVSVFASAINLGVAIVLLRVGRRHASITLEADARHLMTDVWTSIGVVLGLALVTVTGWQILDPLVAIAVALNIVWSGVGLMRRSADGLLDATLPEEENRRINDILDRHRRQGYEFHELRTRQAGAGRFMTVHVLVPGSMSVQAGHDLVERIEAEIRAAVGEIVVVTHLEPLEDQASFTHGGAAAGRDSLKSAGRGRVGETKKP
ncbi:MAG: HAD-IC family P-type ATPase, partial [Candidatus Methylumidiphilus sp.]